jgi:thioredoxin 1
MYANDYVEQEPTRAEVELMPGPVVLEFGAPNCAYCSYARPAIERALKDGPTRHVKIEDGKGRELGRSFQIKLWPTLVFLRDGIEAERVVRPRKLAEIQSALARIEEPSAGP